MLLGGLRHRQQQRRDDSARAPLIARTTSAKNGSEKNRSSDSEITSVTESVRRVTSGARPCWGRTQRLDGRHDRRPAVLADVGRAVDGPRDGAAADTGQGGYVVQRRRAVPSLCFVVHVSILRWRPVPHRWAGPGAVSLVAEDPPPATAARGPCWSRTTSRSRGEPRVVRRDVVGAPDLVAMKGGPAPVGLTEASVERITLASEYLGMAGRSGAVYGLTTGVGALRTVPTDITPSDGPRTHCGSGAATPPASATRTTTRPPVPRWRSGCTRSPRAARG